MKKQLIYVGLLLVALGFSACDEDFKDWADPQSNPQEDATEQLTAVFAPGKDASIIMDGATADSVEIASIASTTAEEGSVISINSVRITEAYTLPFTVIDGVLRVNLAELDSVTQRAYLSRASVERELKLAIEAFAITPSGESLLLAGNEVSINLTPKTTPEPDPTGYFVVGDFTGWNPGGAMAMTQDAENENLYVLDIEIGEDEQNFKFYPAAAITASIDWGQALGSDVDTDTRSENLITWEAEKNPGAIQIAKGGKIRITLDVFNYRYTVKDTSAPDDIFMTGSAYDWGGVWNQFIPIHSAKGSFWGIYYFNADDEVKFAPQADWGGDFGFAATISQESIDRAGLSDSGGNIKVANAGWYLVYVSVLGDDKSVEFFEPNVYLIGDVASGGWEEQLTEQDLFTVPTTADGEFVSPAFSNAGELRICVHFMEDIDWWRTEFLVLDGKIAYRGVGDDQERVKGTPGQKVYLKFSDNTGSIK